MVIALAVGGGTIEHGDGCDPPPPIAATELTVSTPGSAQLDPAHAVLTVRVPLLTMPIRAFVGGPGLRWESDVLMPMPSAPGNRAVSGDEERLGARLPPLRHDAKYDVALVYAETPDGCLPPRPTLIGNFTVP